MAPLPPPSQRRPKQQPKSPSQTLPGRSTVIGYGRAGYLPASDADIWFASGSAAYYEDLDSKDLSKAVAAHWAEYRSLSSLRAEREAAV